jgi:hypothetical protein
LKIRIIYILDGGIIIAFKEKPENNYDKDFTSIKSDVLDTQELKLKNRDDLSIYN